jgi:hypothetical protein
MVGLSLDCCVAPDNGISLSLTHPPTATQSAATASSVPTDFIQTDFDMSSSLSLPEPTASTLAGGTGFSRFQYLATTGPPNLKSRPNVTTEKVLATL